MEIIYKFILLWRSFINKFYSCERCTQGNLRFVAEYPKYSA